MAKRKKGFSYSAGEWGRNRVRAFEQDGRLYLEWRAEGKRNRLSLDHTDTSRAKQAADKVAADFATLAAKPKLAEGKLTLRSLFDIYLREKSTGKGERQQIHERRCAEMFLRYYGPNREACTLALQDWDRFIRDRREGRIAPAQKRQAGRVGDRTIQYDLAFLTCVLKWAERAGDGRGGVLLERNPFKGFKPPKEKSPNRPHVTEEEYRKLLAAAGSFDWRYGALLVMAHETGHRIGAIRRLRWNDVKMDERCVHWPQHSDKIGMAHSTPLSQTPPVQLWRRPEPKGHQSGAVGFSHPPKTQARNAARITSIAYGVSSPRRQGFRTARD